MGENALSAIVIQVSFDTQALGASAASLLSAKLRCPANKQRGAARVWTVTYHPIGGKCSKVGKHDHTVTIGSTHPDRAWLCDLMTVLSNRRRPQVSLFELTPARWVEKFHQSRTLAGLGPSFPHKLRHGGASADALLVGPEKVDDLTLADRGDWASTKSISRYRRPVKYVRELQ